MTLLSNFLVDSKKAKFLVIDAQNDVCDGNSAYANSMYSPGKKRDIKPIQETIENGVIPFLEKARKHKLQIGFVQSIYQPGQYSYSGISDKWLTIDSELQNSEWRIRIYRDMPIEREPIFKKDTQETFTFKGEENGLASWLLETENVLVAGFTTDGCVKKAVYALLERGYKPIVLEDCIATSRHKIKTSHKETLNEFMANVLIKVINSKKIHFLDTKYDFLNDPDLDYGFRH